MDKVSDTPRKADFITLLNANAEIDILRQFISVWYEIAANRLRELAEQKEQFRVLEDELLVLGDERNAAEARSNLLACALRALLSKCPDCGGTGEVQTMTMHLESCFVCSGERQILLKECGK